MGGIILAGGRSSRMGRDKADVELDGHRLLDIVAGRVSLVTDSIVIVGGNQAQTGSIPDLFPGEGPLGGLITGLERLGPGDHIAVACDMPFVSEGVLRMLLSRIEGYCAVIPEARGTLHPLCACYRGESANTLRSIFEKGERSITRAVRGLHAFVLPESALREIDADFRSLLSVNTPEDLERAREIVATNV